MILELLAMPLARRILGAALVFAALAAIVFAIYHAGTHAGATAEASRQVAAGKASFERIEADVRGRLDAASAREQQLATLVDKLTSDSAVASGRATAAQSTAAADRARIAALSDSALRSDLAQRLGGVIPSGEPMGLIGPQSRNPSVSAGNPSAPHRARCSARRSARRHRLRTRRRPRRLQPACALICPSVSSRHATPPSLVLPVPVLHRAPADFAPSADFAPRAVPATTPTRPKLTLPSRRWQPLSPCCPISCHPAVAPRRNLTLPLAPPIATTTGCASSSPEPTSLHVSLQFGDTSKNPLAHNRDESGQHQLSDQPPALHTYANRARPLSTCHFGVIRLS